MTVLVIGDLYGQQTSSRRRSVRQSERVARANWQPTREHVRSDAVETAAVDDDEAQQLRESRVRAVDHHTQAPVQELPTPPAERSVIEPMPLDGQIVLEPMPGPIVQGGPIVHRGPTSSIVQGVPVSGMPLACDAIGAPCGCGDVLCAGDCGSCDSCSSGTCGLGDCTTCGELCSDVAWRPCITLCLPQDGWISFEYLGWYQDGMDLPPLVTSNSDSGVARTQAGVLGSPSTTVLYGGEVLDDMFDGGRLRFGVWLDRRHTWGIGAEYFRLGREREGFNGTSSGNPILARPFFNTETGVEDSELVAYPNVISGSVGVGVDSELTGGGFHMRYLTRCSEGCSSWLFCGVPEQYCSRTEARFGYRFMELDEGVLITEDLTSTDAANPGSFDIIDQFRTRNQFNGFDMGWMYRQTRGFWTFDSTIRLAVGNTRQTVAVAGQTTVNDPGNTPQVQTLPGGLLTQTSNLGVYRRDEFSVIPEFEANIGYQLTDHFRVTLGYTGIYWSNVVRPGEHISRDLNPNLLPPPSDPFSGSQRPAFAFDHTDYWVQGINFGGEYRW